MSKYTYFTDELGHILETHDHDLDLYSDTRLQPYRKPMRPPWVKTPEQVKAWLEYWDRVASWWEGERANERREEW